MRPSTNKTLPCKRRPNGIARPVPFDVGIVSVGVNASMDAKTKYPWAHDISSTMYYEYNAAYCVVNEARNNWSPLVASYAQPLVEGLLENAEAGEEVTISDVVNVVNKGLWGAMGHNKKSPIA